MPGDVDVIVSYRSGDWVAVIGPAVWLLVDGSPDELLLSEAWDAARREDGPAAVEKLLRDELARAPRSFAMAALSNTGLDVLIAGEGVAEVGSGAAREMRCPAGVSVAEYHLAQCLLLLSVRGGAVTDDVSFPIHSGIARAGVVRFEWIDRSTPTSLTPEDEIERPAPAGVPVEDEIDRPAADSLPLDEERPGLPAVADQQEQQLPVADPGATLTPISAGDLPVVVNEPPPELDPPAVDVVQGADYSHLFGLTVSRSVEDAAVRPEEPAWLDEPGPSQEPSAVPPASLAPPIPVPSALIPPVPSAPPLPEPPTVLPAPPAPTLVLRAPASGMIEEFPWASDEAPQSAPVSSASEEESFGLTVNREVQKALLDQMATADQPNPTGPTVHAVRCPGQHPNPAHAGICRVCGIPIVDQSPVTVPRPALGRLRLSTGDDVTLDRGVLMGRGPEVGRQVGGERPHVVKLASPGHDISRNHLEVRLDGWHVLVVDLNSTNGTLITRPGHAPERLRPEQPTMIEPGTVVALADDVMFTYEVA